MRETIMVATKTRAAVVGFGIGVSFFAFLIGATESLAGILDATWTAPRTNADGSALTDLASYRVYYGTQSAPCPGTTRAQVASPTSSPSANQTVTSRLTGLTTGTRYNIAVSAVDAAGNESACSSVASAVARSDFAVSPTGTVNFGAVTIGSFADQVFTVSNTGGGTVSGSASAAAPFSVVSGSPFTLAGVGATQTVTVRFTPTTTATASATVSFTANGGSSSAIATGSGAALADTTPPTIALTAPLGGATVSGKITVSASAADNVGVAGVQFKLDGVSLGIQVATPPYAVTWDTTTAASGAHTLSAVARDASGNTGTSAGVTVTVANGSTATAPTAPTGSATTS